MFRLFFFVIIMLGSCDNADFGGGNPQPGIRCRQSDPNCKTGSGGNPGGDTSGNPGGDTSGNPGGTTSGNPGGATSGNPGGATSGNPGGTTSGTPGGQTSGLGNDGGGSTAVADAKISFNTWFDGKTNLTLNLQTGDVSYTNTGTYALQSVKLIITNGAGQSSELAIAQGMTQRIPNWRSAKNASPSGYQNFRSNNSNRGTKNPPIVQTNVVNGLLTIYIDDDLGGRPGAISFPNFDLGLSY